MIAVDSIFKIKRYYKTFGIRQFERAQHCVRVLRFDRRSKTSWLRGNQVNQQNSFRSVFTLWPLEDVDEFNKYNYFNAFKSNYYYHHLTVPNRNYQQQPDNTHKTPLIISINSIWIISKHLFLKPYCIHLINRLEIILWGRTLWAMFNVLTSNNMFRDKIEIVWSFRKTIFHHKIRLFSHFLTPPPLSSYVLQ